MTAATYGTEVTNVLALTLVSFRHFVAFVDEVWDFGRRSRRPPAPSASIRSHRVLRTPIRQHRSARTLLPVPTPRTNLTTLTCPHLPSRIHLPASICPYPSASTALHAPTSPHLSDRTYLALGTRVIRQAPAPSSRPRCRSHTSARTCWWAQRM